MKIRLHVDFALGIQTIDLVLLVYDLGSPKIVLVL
jgi:hypothetical protein